MATWFGKATDLIGLTQQGKAEDAMNQALAGIGGVGLPKLTPIQLQELVSQGEITPEQAQYINLQQTEMANIYVDPRLKAAQMDALTSLQDIAKNEGMTAADRALQQQIISEEEAKARGQREAILQGAQARGVGGSGVELMSQMKAQQEAASRAAARDAQMAAAAQQNKLAALQQAGALGGQMQGQEFNQQSQIAQAKDVINKYNTQNKQDVLNQNAAMRNQAAQAALAEKQRIADQNTALRNQSTMYNAGLPQQQYQNQLNKAGAMAGAYGNLANMYGQQDEQNWRTAMGMAAAYKYSDKEAKKDIKESDAFDVDEFLNSMTPYKFSYKNPEAPGAGPGRQLGVMAQDVEKSKIGQEFVENTPQGKMLNFAKAGSGMLASLANINDRLKKLEE